jgi:threonine aldolase
MFKAVVGDDVYKQDPTVIELEAKLQRCLVWSRTFLPFWNNNQTAIKLHTQGNN